MDIPREFVIRESTHRIHNPFREEDLATLGRAIWLRPGQRLLDLACGSGEMLCTWARDHAVTGHGVDLSAAFLSAARARAAELAVEDRVTFEHADAAGYVSEQPVDVAACLGATWIGGGVAGTAELLSRSLVPGGTVLVGEPYWREQPADQETVAACGASTAEDFLDLPGLVASFPDGGWDLVEMVLADEAGWDRYAGAQWWNVRRWLDAHPDDELAPAMRAELDAAPVRHVRYQRRFLGWGVFALRRR
jgi:SAM-dependent methyltransferase